MLFTVFHLLLSVFCFLLSPERSYTRPYVHELSQHTSLSSISLFFLLLLLFNRYRLSTSPSSSHPILPLDLHRHHRHMPLTFLQCPPSSTLSGAPNPVHPLPQTLGMAVSAASQQTMATTIPIKNSPTTPGTTGRFWGDLATRGGHMEHYR